MKDQRNEGKCQACHGIRIGEPETIGHQIRNRLFMFWLAGQMVGRDSFSKTTYVVNSSNVHYAFDTVAIVQVFTTILDHVLSIFLEGDSLIHRATLNKDTGHFFFLVRILTTVCVFVPTTNPYHPVCGYYRLAKLTLELLEHL